MLIRKKLTASEFSSPFLRYDEVCDCVQFTPDGGETWIDQPANDPRTSDAYRLPALTGDDTQCRAAEGMVALVRACVDQRLQFDTDLEIAGGILGIVAFIPGFNVLWALILAAAALAVTIARELLEAAFTEDVYDTLRCTFYCHIDADGQMSVAQFNDAYTEIDDYDLYPNVLTQTWVHTIMNLVGAVGLSDAGVALEAAADCDECDCGWCYTWDFTETDGGWTPRLGDYGIYHPGEGWRETPGGGLILGLNFPAGQVTSIEYCGQSSAGSAYGWGTYWRYSSANVYVSTNPGSGIAYCNPSENDLLIDEVWLNPYAGSFSSQLITSCTIRGTGVMPAFTEGEEC